MQLLLDGNEPGLPPRNSTLQGQREGQVSRASASAQRRAWEAHRRAIEPTDSRHRPMEPISIPGSMASPLSSNRRRHVAGAMTNTHALRGTSPMSGPDIAAYKEYQRSFDELSRGVGGVATSASSRSSTTTYQWRTAPVVHQQRRPSQRRPAAIMQGVTARAPSRDSVVSVVHGVGLAGSVSASSAPAPASRPRRGGRCGRPTRSSVVCRLGLGSGASRRGRCRRARRHRSGRARDAVAVSSLARDVAVQVARDGVAPQNVPHLQRHRHDGHGHGASLEIAHFWGDALSVSTTTTHVQPARAPGAGRAVTCADLAAFQGDATHLGRPVEERSVAARRRAPGKWSSSGAAPWGDASRPSTPCCPGHCGEPSSGRARRRHASPRVPSPVASPPARRPAPTGAYVRPVPTRDGVRSLLRTFPRHWTDIEEHTTWGRPENVRKDVVLRVDEKPAVQDPTSYRTHHLRRP